MKATIEHLEEVTISKSNSGYYIMVKGMGDSELYLHKDGTIDKICGAANFHDSFIGAARFVSSLIESLTPKSVKVKLNDNHTAEVFKDKIVVDCQTFPISVLDELYNAHESIS
jgi:hypothetical protein